MNSPPQGIEPAKTEVRLNGQPNPYPTNGSLDRKTGFIYLYLYLYVYVKVNKAQYVPGLSAVVEAS